MRALRNALSLLFVGVMLLTLASLAAQCPPAPGAPTAAPPAATTAAPTAKPTGPTKGGTIIVGTPQEPGVLSPLLSSQSIADAISSFTVEGLIGVDATGQNVPVLAEALPTLSADGLVVTYKLKKNIKFSNGDPCNCGDVKFTLDATLSDLSQAGTSGYKDIQSIDCPDDYTAVITFKKVYAPYLRLFRYIIPRAAGDLAQLDKWAYNRQPIGTGPWILKEWVSGDHMTFVPNPYYREQGKPYLDQVIVKILPSREVGMQLLGTGEIDVLWDVTESDFPQLDKMKDKGVSYASATLGENELLLLNFADPKVDAPEDPAKAPHPILSDLRVRQAIQYAIDKKTLVNTLLYGKVEVGSTVLPPGAGPFVCPQPLSEFNVEKAKSLLEEAGWKVGADGIRTKGDLRLKLKIATTSGNQLREQTEQVLVEMLKKAGIELVIENVPSDVLLAGWDSKGMRKHGNFDILLYTTGYFMDPDNHLFTNYHSARIPTEKNKGAGNNFSRYINADVDKWIDDAAATMDQKVRQDLYCKIAEQINKDIPRIYLYQRLLISGYRTRLQNFAISPGTEDFTVGSQNWYIKQ